MHLDTNRPIQSHRLHYVYAKQDSTKHEGGEHTIS